MSVYEQLINMGYAAETAQLASGSERNLNQALNYIENDGIGFDNLVAPVVATKEPSGSEATEEELNVPTVAQSFKCNECGKLLPNDSAMLEHGKATKHQNFMASTEKVYSTEDRQAQVVDIIRKIKENNERKAKEEADAAQEAELNRRSAAGQAMAGYREEAREREIKEAARQLRLKKSEDEIAKQRILEQIRLDREERKAKEAGYVAPAQVSPEHVTPAKDYTVTMIQFRLLDGSVVKQEFKVDEPLVMLRGWVEANHANGTPFTMMTAFPRKVFTEEDMGTPLHALKLVPTASITLLNRTV